jgi:Ca-activated chloride channel family protein
MRFSALLLLVFAFAVTPLRAEQGSSPSARKPAQKLPQTQEDDNSAATMRVDVRLVNVFVSVTDSNGAPFTKLSKNDFTLFENGAPQRIALFDRESELPLSIVACIDTSLSTRKDLTLEVLSARKFAHTLLRPVDAMALYQFNENVTELVPFTSNLKRIDDGLDRVRLGAATAMYDAIYLSSRSLLDRNGRKVLVVITDGGDTVSEVTYHAALQAAQEAEAILYSIIIVPIEASAGRDTGGENALIQLSKDTGGKHYYATGQKGLDEAFRQISEELRTQFLLAYYPSQRLTDSSYRRIRIEVHSPEASDLTARYRTGYYTSKAK